MQKPLRLLLVEDSEDDMLLLVRELRNGGYEPMFQRVDTGPAMRDMLKEHDWDVVISDYSMPHFSGPEALVTLQEIGLDLPFIIVSGAIGEEIAVSVMKKGAHDYLIKGNLKRLVPVIEREMREAADRALRRRAQQELNESEEHFRMLTENSHDWITRHSLTGEYMYVSGACRKLLGYEPSELINRRPWDYVDDRSRPGLLAVFANAQSDSLTQRLEYLARHRNGTSVWCETVYWTRRDPRTNALLEIHAATRDITAHKMVETTLQATNEKLENRVRIRTAELEQTNASLEAEIEERRRIEAEREALNRALETKNQQLEGLLMNAEKLASVGRMAAGVAHEIRNPLTSLKLSLFSIGKALKDNTRLQDNVRVMSEEIQRLESVIRNFLEFSRPPTLKNRPTAVRALVDDLLTLFRHQLSRANVTTHVDVPLDLPQLMVDPDQIKQVFLNLVANAIDAMPQGGEIHITADTLRGDNGLSELQFRFADTGPGISAEQREHIFDAFFTTKPEGTGLGLAISARILKNHGGSLSLEPAGDRGAVFLLRLPVDDGGPQ